MLLWFVGCVLDNSLAGKPSDGAAFDSAAGTPPDTDTDGATVPAEVCNGVDDDGDGAVDEDFPDADGNGRVDCLDTTCPALTVGAAGAVAITPACEATTVAPVTDPWAVRIQWQVGSTSGISTPAVYAAPMVGNLTDDDGDGVVDEDDTPDVVVNVGGTLAVYDGATGSVVWTWAGAGHYHGVAVADVDVDGYPDVVTVAENGAVVCLDGGGREVWRSTAAVTNNTYAVVSVADLDEDGEVEVIADDLVVRGRDGGLRFSLGIPMSNMPGRMAAVADADNDGDQELFIGGEAYDDDGALLWSTGEIGTYGFWPVVVQADTDPEAEIGFVGAEWTLWEADGSNVYRRSYGTPSQPGPPCAGDFDGDGVSEVVWPSFRTLVMYELDGTPVWSVPMEDSSGVAGCSGYDVDGDGALEVLYADQVSFSIVDGATGVTRYTNPNHRSVTIFEYPTVADIDHDGHAEILVAANGWTGPWGFLTAFEHDGDGWPAAGSTWGIHDFAITNIDPDGTVPTSPDPSWTTYNVYRARVAADGAAWPDLVARVTDVCVADCDYGPVEVAVQVENRGGRGVPAGAELVLYADDATGLRAVGTWSLPEVAAGEALAGVTLSLLPADVGERGFVAVVDPGGDVAECDEANNQDEWSDVFCP